MQQNVKNLYVLTAEEGAARDRVEAAMDWLLSADARGIGEALLRDAYALHGKPVTIKVSPDFERYNGKTHTVAVNPSHLRGIFIEDAHGKSHPLSLERVLAHELKHAATPDNPRLAEEKSALKHRIKDRYMKRLGKGVAASVHAELIKAGAAPDYETAMGHIERFVDEVYMPLDTELNRILIAHPDYLRLIKKIEGPALETENKVAALRGEPLRISYSTHLQESPEASRRTVIGEISDKLGIRSKPHAATTLTSVEPMPAEGGEEPAVIAAIRKEKERHARKPSFVSRRDTTAPAREK